MGSIGLDYPDAEIQSLIGRKDILLEIGNDKRDDKNPLENDTIDSGEWM